MDEGTLIALGTWTNALALGLVYVGLACAVYLTFRILAFPDLTVNGSVSLGAALSTGLLVVQGWNPWAVLPLAFLAGAGAGLLTGLLHTQLQINGLLASILVTLGLYSINLRLLGDRANIGLVNEPTVYDALRPAPAGLPGLGDAIASLGALGRDSYIRQIGVAAVLAVLLVAALAWWLHSEQGLALRATGDNGQMVRALGVSTERMTLLGLAVANGCAGLSGALLVQKLGFYDISLGSDAIIVGLAGVIGGEALLRGRSVNRVLVGLVVGSMLYQLATAAVLEQQLIEVHATDLRLATALLVIAALALPLVRARLTLPRATQATPAPPVTGGTS